MEKVTINHEEIMEWAQKHNGSPQIMSYNCTSQEAVGLKINFPGTEDDALLSESNPPKNVSWEEFFAVFDQLNLAFIYEDRQFRLDASYAYRFIDRNTVLAEAETVG